MFVHLTSYSSEESYRVITKINRPESKLKGEKSCVNVEFFQAKSTYPRNKIGLNESRFLG